jgi:hypothetical protein
MNREIHVRICESLRGQFPRATRPDRPRCLTLSSLTQACGCGSNAFSAYHLFQLMFRLLPAKCRSAVAKARAWNLKSIRFRLPRNCFT